MKSPYICITKFCRRPRCKKNFFCSRCKMRAWRAANPLKNYLSVLRERAIKKKIPFDLDLEWLGEFLEKNHFDRSLHHVDRICVFGGYTKGNLQVLLISENIAKGNRERYGQAHMF